MVNVNREEQLVRVRVRNKGISRLKERVKKEGCDGNGAETRFGKKRGEGQNSLERGTKTGRITHYMRRVARYENEVYPRNMSNLGLN